MYRRRELLRRICVALALCGARPAGAQAPDLIATLSARLAITREQAARGAGAVFRLAEQRLSPPEFSIITASLPGVARLLDVAPALAPQSDGIADLELPFSLLGMPATLVPPFVAIVLDFARANGSGPVAGLFDRTLRAP